MDRKLTEIGTIPVTTSIIESLYPELKSANKKVTWLEKQGIYHQTEAGTLCGSTPNIQERPYRVS